MLVKLATSYTDRELMRSFSKEKNKTAFFQKVSSKDIGFYIRPLSRRKQGELVSIIRKTATPAFSSEKIAVRDLRTSLAVEVLKDPSEMIFHFFRVETFTFPSLRYFA